MFNVDCNNLTSLDKNNDFHPDLSVNSAQNSCPGSTYVSTVSSMLAYCCLLMIPSGIYNENFPFTFTQTRIGLPMFLFSIPLGSVYHARAFVPRQNHPSKNMV